MTILKMQVFLNEPNPRNMLIRKHTLKPTFQVTSQLVFPFRIVKFP